MVEDAAATVRVLPDRECDVGSRAATLERSVAAVSQQLGTLSRAGLVRPRRAGRYRIHALDGGRPSELLGIIAERSEAAGQRGRGRCGG